MTISLTGLLILLLIAGICGAIGRAIGGGTGGGFLVSIAVGFIGALLGAPIAKHFHLPELLYVTIDGQPFPSSGRSSAPRCSSLWCTSSRVARCECGERTARSCAPWQLCAVRGRSFAAGARGEIREAVRAGWGRLADEQGRSGGNPCRRYGGPTQVALSILHVD